VYGGVETLLVTLARLRHLCPGMEPEFGLNHRGRLWDELTAAGALVHDLGPVRFSRPWTVRAARRRLWPLSPEVVVCHGSWPHAVYAPAAAGRLVYFVHARPGRGWVDRLAARTRPAAVVANSRFTAEGVAGLFPGVPATVVYPPLEVTDRSAARDRLRAEFRVSAETVVVLMAARPEAGKGYAIFLDAVHQLRDFPGWVAWVAGGPPGPLTERVRFLGPRSDVPDLMAAADIYCQPNTGPEGFGLTFAEALAAGLPVVTSAIGGALEVVSPDCGLLTAPGDAGAVAEALAGLIGGADLRRALGAAGPARVRALCDPATQLEKLRRAVAP
jgi:glycosyltransferase involved in cell wall biosynthesis